MGALLVNVVTEMRFYWVFILSLSCRISSVNQELFFAILALGIQDFSIWEIMCAYGINYTKIILHICIILYSLLGYFMLFHFKKQWNRVRHFNCLLLNYVSQQRNKIENRGNLVLISPSSESNIMPDTRRAHY